MKRIRIRRTPTFIDMAKAFGPVDAMLARLEQGWIHSIKGNPVFYNTSDSTWYDIPAALEGWIALWQRIAEHKQLELDLQPMRLLAARLHHGTPITPDEVARCVDIVTATKRHYRCMDVFDIGKLVKTQLIANNLEEMGVTTT